MSTAKKITSMILVLVMLLTVAPASVIASAALVTDTSQYTYGAITEEPVSWVTDTSATTDVIRVAYAANSFALGTQIVAATPSGIPVITNNAPYIGVANGGETAENAKIIFTISGILPDAKPTITSSLGTANMTLSATPNEKILGTTATYTWEVLNGTASANTDVIFTINYVVKGKTYTDYAYSHVEDILVQSAFAVHNTKTNWINRVKTRIGFIGTVASKNMYSRTMTTGDNRGFINYAQTSPVGNNALVGVGSEGTFSTEANAYGTRHNNTNVAGTRKTTSTIFSNRSTSSRYNICYGDDDNRPKSDIYIDKRNETLQSLNYRLTAQITEKDAMGQMKYEKIGVYNTTNPGGGKEQVIPDSSWTTNGEIAYTLNTSSITTLGTALTTYFSGTGPSSPGNYGYSLAIAANADDDAYSAGYISTYFHVYDTSDLYAVYRGAMIGNGYSYTCTTTAYSGAVLSFPLAGSLQASWFNASDWSRFAAAYQAAGKILADPRVTATDASPDVAQSVIDAAAIELWNAYEALRTAGYKNPTVNITVKHVLATDNSVEIIPDNTKSVARGNMVTANAATIRGFTLSNSTPSVQQKYADGSNAEETIVFAYNPNDVQILAFTNNDNGDMNNYTAPYQSTWNVSTASADVGTKAGYEFSGKWYYDSNFTQEATTITMGLNQVIIYAKWIPASVNVYLDTQLSGVDPIQLDDGSYRPADGAPVAFNRPATDPSVPGYIFVDYYADAGLTTQLEWPLTLRFGDSAHTVYGRFVDVKNKIIFETNGGSTVNDITYTIGETITPPTSEKTGYTLEGWYLDRELTNPVDWSKATDDETGFVAYAKWSSETYQIRFDMNHIDFSNVDTTSIDPVSAAVGSKVANDDVPPVPRRLGYTFEYWQVGGKAFDFTTDAIPAITPSVDSATGVKYITATAIWRATDYSAVIELDSYEKLLGNLVSTDETPTQPGDIITVQMTSTTNFYTGSSLFVFMYDQTLFDLVGTGADVFTLNKENDYISGINAKYTAVTNSANMPWPTGLDSTKYAAIQIAIDPTVALDNYNTEPMADGTWMVEFQLKVKDTAAPGEYKNAVYMAEEWVRNENNLTGTMFYGWTKSSTSVLDTYNNVVTPDLTTAYVDITISDEQVQQTTVNLDAGEGAVFADGKQTASYTGRAETEIEGYVKPTKTGYTLVNWTNKDASSTYTTWDEGYYLAAADDGDEFLANWKADEFTVTYYTEVGGDVVHETQIVEYETNITGPNAEPTKEGYTFAGWVDVDGQAVTLPVACPLNDVELYATWAPATNTEYKIRVTYINNATGVATTPTPTTKTGTTGYTVVIDYAANIPATPAADTIYLTIENDLPTIANGNYIFDTDTYTGPITGVIAADGSLILDIRYCGKPVTATFDAYGGTFSDGTTQIVQDDKEFQMLPDVPATPTREGFDFKGWATSTANADKGTVIELTANAARLNSDKTFYASWGAKTGHVRFMIDTVIQHGDLVEVAYGSPITAPATNPTKEGYDFVGWAEVPNSETGTMSLGNMDALDDATLGYAKTYYAAFKLSNFTVTYKVDNAATGEIETYTMGSDVIVRNEPSKTGYNFSGWSIEGGEALTAGQTISMPANNLVIVGTFTAKEIGVKFNAGDGKFADGTNLATVPTDFDSEYILPDEPTKAGYSFMGWVDNEGNSPADLGTLTEEAKEFTAVWEANAKDYYVYIYIMDTTGAYPAKDAPSDTETLSGTVDAPVDTYVPATKAGFTVDTQASVVDGTVPAEGDLILEVYYIRDRYDIVYDVDGVDTTKTYYYEEAIPAIDDPQKVGYTFKAWSPAVPATMPIGGIEVAATWTTNKYKVTFYTDDTKTATHYSADHEYLTAVPTVNNPAARDGYKFLGWAYEGTTDIVDLSTITVPSNDITFVGIWEIQSYKLVYKSRTGDFASYDVVYGTPKAEWPVPATTPDDYTGYYFTKWSDVTNATMPSSQVVISAEWAIESYTLKFNTDGGSEIGDITANYGASVTVPADPTKTGYTFAGWDDTIPTTMPDLGADGAEKTFTASWTINEYTITFNTDGGNEIAPIKQNYGTAVTAPADPTKTGYTFAGWDKTVPTTMPAENMTIKAQWTVNQYTITFDTDGGSEITPIKGNYASVVTAPDAPTKEGHTFTGWDKEIPSTMPAENITIKAQWSVNAYKITFNTDGGSEVAPIEQNFGTAITAPADPTKAGYTFAGWDTEIPATMPAKNMTIKAQWTINEYTITFDTDGGSEVAPIKQNYNTAVIKPADPTKEGYTFAGWDKEIPSVMPNENITIKAKWTVNQYTITFDTAGGSEVAPIKQDYGTAITAPAAPTKTGYDFAGWDVSVPATMPANNMTITAKWTIKQYTITCENTGDTTIAPIKQDYGTAITAPGTPSKVGYTWGGWDKTIPATMPAEDMVITGSWTINQYTIRFVETDDYGSETAEVASEELDYGAIIADIVPEAASDREYYTFEGWALTPNAPVEEVITDFGTVPANNVTYYAVYARVPVTLTLVAGSTTVIDKDNAPDASLTGGEAITGYIYGLETKLTVDKLTANYLAVEGDGRLEVTPTKFNRCGTGTKVEVIDNVTDEVTETYFIIIFGDINGDSNVDATDYTALEKEVAPRNESVATNWSVAMNGEEVNANYDHCKVMAADLDANDAVEAADLAVLNDVNFRRVVIDQTVGTTYIPE